MWIQMVTDAVREQYAVRECKVCTSLIANDRSYGRKASKAASNICEVCEVATQEQLEKLRGGG